MVAGPDGGTLLFTSGIRIRSFDERVWDNFGHPDDRLEVYCLVRQFEHF